MVIKDIQFHALHPIFICLVFCFTVGTIDVGKARLMFWDLGGQEELQSLWDKVSFKYLIYPLRLVDQRLFDCLAQT